MSRFNKIWESHPSVDSLFDDFPCKNESGAKAFDNQCAIRLGVALEAAGIATSGFRARIQLPSATLALSRSF